MRQWAVIFPSRELSTGCEEILWNIVVSPRYESHDSSTHLFPPQPQFFLKYRMTLSSYTRDSPQFPQHQDYRIITSRKDFPTLPSNRSNTTHKRVLYYNTGCILSCTVTMETYS